MKNGGTITVPVAPRYLIVNADDFGLSRGVNRGIVRAFRNGVLTSASLMVYGSAAKEAANFGRRNRELSLGLHVDLAEWIYSDGDWMARYKIIDTEDPKAITRELSKQLRLFRNLVGKEPTHIDSHQHAHQREPVRSILLEAAQTLSIPLRSFSPCISYCGDFYGQTGEGAPFPKAITIKNLLTILSQLPSGWTELGCHPGDDERLDSVYRKERKKEVTVLCHPRIRKAIESLGLKLCSFRALPITLSMA